MTSIERGMWFGDYHTGLDWGLILNSKSYTPPTAKTSYVSVDGRDGSLDLTESLTGDVKYDDRKGTYKFIGTQGTYDDRERLISEIIHNVHGRRLHIVGADDISHYMDGRCQVSDVTNTNAYCTLTITTTCDPYMYTIDPVIYKLTVASTENTSILVNRGTKVIVPEFKVDGGSVNIKIGTTSTTVSDGTYKFTNVRLPSGNTVLTYSGSGTLTITYSEGVL